MISLTKNKTSLTMKPVLTQSELLQILKLNKNELKKKYSIKELGLFGSYAYNMANENSDVDFMVEFEKPIGLDFVLLEEELEEITGLKVDLVSKKAIKPKMMPFVLENIIYV